MRKCNASKVWVFQDKTMYNISRANTFHTEVMKA